MKILKDWILRKYPKGNESHLHVSELEEIDFWPLDWCYASMWPSILSKRKPDLVTSYIQYLGWNNNTPDLWEAFYRREMATTPSTTAELSCLSSPFRSSASLRFSSRSYSMYYALSGRNQTLILSAVLTLKSRLRQQWTSHSQHIAISYIHMVRRKRECW